MVFFSCKNLASLIQCQSSEKQTGHSIMKELGGKRGYLTHTPYLQVCAASPACTWKPPRTAVPGKEGKTPTPEPAIPPCFETCGCCIKPDSWVDQIPLMKP